jgi:hypothetical protein
MPISGFGGLAVACWPLVPKFAGLKTRPKPSDFSGQKKYPQHTPSFGGEVKAVLSHVANLWLEKEPLK